MNVAEIRFNDKDAPAAFTKSLKETGFGVITDHPIDLSLMELVYNDWKQFFNSDSKFEYLFDPLKQDGYFPCLLYTSPSPRDRTRSRMPSSA